jgi:hypothetical protein
VLEPDNSYPAKLEIDYPDRPLNRLSSFFRLFYAIPIMIVMALLYGMYNYQNPKSPHEHWEYFNTIYVFLPLILMLLFRRKYPRWWFDWNVALLKLGTRFNAYLLLLRDEYPSTDEEQAVHIEIPYPDASTELNRWLPLVKWFLAIPHFVVLCVLAFGMIFSVIFAWFAILFTARYPRSLFDFIVGVERWSIRVAAYAFLLVTDKYPPFRLGD